MKTHWLKLTVWSIVISAGFIAVTLLLVAHAALATPASITFNVNTTVDAIDDNSGNGVCHTAANQCTLRAAIMEADKSTTDVTINVPVGIYELTIPPTGTDTITNGDLNLTAPGAGNPIITLSGAGIGQTIIDGNHIDRVIQIDNGRAVIIAGVTIRNGDAEHASSGLTYGGGIENGGTLMLNGSQIVSNSGYYGGGIDTRGLLRVSNSTVNSNSAAAGGGGISDWSTLADSTLITDTTVAYNTANVGGGLSRDYVGNGLLHVINSAIYSNTAIYNGGGIDLGYYFQGNLYLINSTVSHNRAKQDGGGIAIEGASPNSSAWLYNDTIAYNIAGADLNYAGKGGGISSEGTAVFTSEYSIYAWNTDVYTASDIVSVYTFTQDNPCYGYFAYSHEDIVTNYDLLRCHIPGGPYYEGDPKIGPLQNNGGSTWTHALWPGSPAIDQGLYCSVTTDQRGFARFVDGFCDIGAYESGSWNYLPLTMKNH